MDPILFALAVRFLERMVAVLIGGMAVYLGFRLFREAPRQRNSAGKVGLPWDISIAVTRVGPGVFFALFGVSAVSLALVRPVELSLPQPGGTENPDEHRRVYYGTPTPGDRDARADARIAVRKDIARLNAVPASLRSDLSEGDRDEIL